MVACNKYKTRRTSILLQIILSWNADWRNFWDMLFQVGKNINNNKNNNNKPEQEGAGCSLERVHRCKNVGRRFQLGNILIKDWNVGRACVKSTWTQKYRSITLVHCLWGTRLFCGHTWTFTSNLTKNNNNYKRPHHTKTQPCFLYYQKTVLLL